MSGVAVCIHLHKHAVFCSFWLGFRTLMSDRSRSPDTSTIIVVTCNRICKLYPSIYFRVKKIEENYIHFSAILISHSYLD